MKKNNKIICSIIVIFIVLFIWIIFVCNAIHIKNSKDYSAVDYMKAKHIILNNNIPSMQELDYYDMDNDNKITNNDLEIIKQMICDYYDYYIVIGNNYIVGK